MPRAQLLKNSVWLLNLISDKAQPAARVNSDADIPKPETADSLDV